MACGELKEEKICRNPVTFISNNAFPDRPATFLGSVSSPLECQFRCTLSIFDEEGCCGLDKSKCYWYPDLVPRETVTPGSHAAMCIPRRGNVIGKSSYV